MFRGSEVPKVRIELGHDRDRSDATYAGAERRPVRPLTR